MCFDSISSKDNFVEYVKQALLDRLFSARASSVRAQKKRTSDQRVDENFNQQDFKTRK